MKNEKHLRLYEENPQQLGDKPRTRVQENKLKNKKKRRQEEKKLIKVKSSNPSFRLISILLFLLVESEG